MRKTALALISTASILAGVSLEALPVSATPPNAGERLVAQADFDLPGDLPGAGSSSSSVSQPTRPASNTQAPPSYQQPEPQYQQPSQQPPSYSNQPAPYSAPNYGNSAPNYGSSSGVAVPPDIDDAPAPYTSGGSAAQQQLEIMGQIRPQAPTPGAIRLPADFNKRPRLGIIQVDQNGTIIRTGLKISDQSQLASASILADVDKLIAPDLRSRLSGAQIQALLEHPEIALSSRHAARIFNCQSVLLLSPKQRGSYSGIEIDLRTLGKQRIYATRNGSPAEANSDIISKILKKGTAVDMAVVANQDSFKYHRADADHLSTSSAPQRYANAEAAKQAGLQPCPLCFPEVEYAGNAYTGPISIPDDLPLSQHTDMVRRLSNVSVQLAYANKLSPQTYRVFLLADPDYKAFSYMGGPVLVSEGLLNVLDTPGEVAAIVSHEMSHLLLGHVKLRPQAQQQPAEQEKKQNQGGFLGSMGGFVTSAIGSAVAYTTGSYWAGWGASKLASIGSQFKITFPKHYEEAADRKAVVLAFTAGYSPQDYVLSINKMGSIYQQRTDNEWLIEHRKVEDRLKNIRPLVGQLGTMEMDLRAWGRDDPTLAVAWRQNAQLYLNNPHAFENFAAAYSAAFGTRKAPSK